MKAEVPKKLLHFQIAEELGRGNHGVVYQAIEPGSNRMVAVKHLYPDPEGVDEWCKRRGHSLKNALDLRHANICRLLAVETYQDSLLAVYEHIDGRSLKEVLTDGPLPLRKFFEIGIQLAEGLNTAHTAGLRHGNLHPGNIVVADTGQVKVMDFGLPRMRSRNAGIPPAGFAANMLPYVSPEEVADDSVSQMADLFSLGVIFYLMLSGDLPFSNPDPLQLEESILHDDPDFKRLRQAGVPSELILLVESMLSRRKQDRPSSARELQITLQSIRQFEQRYGESEEEEPKQISPRTYLAVSAIFVLLLIIWTLLAGRH